ncbi:hypothetical protein HY491_01320 [Candidatus Woesearchaeota archaeon]|nr:hypothetical protein [Candidatus Woesearchaeota archaeon]
MRHNLNLLLCAMLIGAADQTAVAVPKIVFHFSDSVATVLDSAAQEIRAFHLAPLPAGLQESMDMEGWRSGLLAECERLKQYAREVDSLYIPHYTNLRSLMDFVESRGEGRGKLDKFDRAFVTQVLSQMVYERTEMLRNRIREELTVFLGVSLYSFKVLGAIRLAP